MTIKWDQEAMAMLTLLYNEGKSDLNIAEYMNSTVYAIAKQRCAQKLTKFSMAKNLKKAPKTVKEKEVLPDCIAYYTKDSQAHILYGTLETIKNKAVRIMKENNLKSLTVYKPVTELVLEQIKEISLKY